MPSVEQVITLYPKQEELYKAVGKYRYIYYGGARGGGKTHACCAVALRLALRHPGINIVIIRQTVEEIKQYIVATIEYILPSERWKRYYKYKEREKVYVFANGSRIFLRPLSNIRDAQKEQGIERNVYIIDEANNIPIDYILPLDGSLRNSRIRGFKPAMIMTGNPGGISDSYFYTHFVRPDYTKWTPEELKGRDEYKFIPAYLSDNPSLLSDNSYRAALERLPTNLKKAWLEGRWDVFSGQFFEEWNDDVHTVKDFPIPPTWKRWRSVDLGRGNHPSVCLWFAQNPDTKVVYCYRELIHYGSATDFARAIIASSFDTWGNEEHYLFTFADPNIFARNNMEYDMEQYFRAEGVILQPSSNDRKMGWKLVKEWLHWKKNEDGTITLPMLQFFRGACSETIFHLPRVRYSSHSGEDCDTRGMDDHADCLRYFCVMVEYPQVEQIPVQQETPLEDLWRVTSTFYVEKVKDYYFSESENLLLNEDNDVYVSPYRVY